MTVRWAGTNPLFECPWLDSEMTIGDLTGICGRGRGRWSAKVSGCGGSTAGPDGALTNCGGTLGPGGATSGRDGNLYSTVRMKNNVPQYLSTKSYHYPVQYPRYDLVRVTHCRFASVGY